MMRRFEQLESKFRVAGFGSAFYRTVFAIALSPGIAAQPARAQISAPEAPVYRAIDANSVDLTSGRFEYRLQELSIGSGEYGGLDANIDLAIVGDDLGGKIVQKNVGVSAAPQFYSVTVGQKSIAFSLDQNGSGMIDLDGSGATLTVSGLEYTFIDHDGMVAKFTAIPPANPGPFAGLFAVLTKVTYPSGRVLSYGSAGGVHSVTSNDGYLIKSVSSGSQLTLFGINSAVDYCNASSLDCAGAGFPWPTAKITGDSRGVDFPVTYTDPIGRVTHFPIYDAGNVGSLQRPSGATATVTLFYDRYACGCFRVTQLATSAGLWNYTYRNNYSGADVYAADGTHKAYGFVKGDQFNDGFPRVSYIVDELNRQTKFLLDSYGRKTEVRLPSGLSTDYTFDSRGNVTKIDITPAPPLNAAPPDHLVEF